MVGKLLTVDVADKVAALGCFVGLEEYTELGEGVCERLLLGHRQIRLDGLREISESDALVLSSYRYGLKFDGLERFGRSAGHIALAECLVRQGGHLDFPRLRELPAEIAAVFSGSRGCLDLEQIRELSEEVTVHLGRCRGTLNLETLERLSPLSAVHLSALGDRLLLTASVRRVYERALRASSRVRVDGEADSVASECLPLSWPFSDSEAVEGQELFASALERELELTNEIGMKFRLIPPGTFLMGSPEDEERRWSDEHQHEVTLTRAFYLGIYPVTQAEWTSVMGSNPSWFSSSGDGSDEVSGQDTSRFPVESVSWDDAQDFLGKLNASYGMSGIRYRLPSEAEWEYACRAGTTSPFSFGGVLQGDQANCDGNYPYGTSSEGPYLERTSAVGSYSSNGFGLYDMHGNVWEWCQDWYGKDYYSSSPSEDPAGPSSGSSRVLRGGSWDRYAGHCRSALRSNLDPAGSNYGRYGFRVLCELS